MLDAQTFMFAKDPQPFWPLSFSGSNPDITLAELLSHRVGLQEQISGWTSGNDTPQMAGFP